MPYIEIPEHLYARLKELAEPFVDTPATVIARLLEAYEKGQEGKTAQIFHRAPPLAHTKVLKASIDGKDVPNPNWNKVARMIHVCAIEKLGSIHNMMAATSANIVKETKDDAGYKPLKGYNISIQGMDADAAWQSIEELSRASGINVEVEFQWRNNEKSAHPGKTGKLIAPLRK